MQVATPPPSGQVRAITVTTVLLIVVSSPRASSAVPGMPGVASGESGLMMILPITKPRTQRYYRSDAGPHPECAAGVIPQGFTTESHASSITHEAAEQSHAGLRLMGSSITVWSTGGPIRHVGKFADKAR
jgi:hypothetical protein